MKWSTIWELVKINILYSNPQLLSSIKKKQSKKKGNFSAYKSAFRQLLFTILLMGIVYSLLFLGVDYHRSVGFFSFQLSLFTLVSFVYGFTGFFSVFYDSKDTKLYLPLPMKNEEVFIAKILSAQSMTLPFLIPCLSLLVITYWQIGGVWTSLLAIPAFLILLLIVNIFNLFLLHFIGQILTKSPYKTTISTILMTVSSLIGFAGIMFLQTQQQTTLQSGGLVEFPIIPIFVGFHYLASQPLSLEFVLNLLLPSIFLISLVIYGYKVIIPNYFNQILSIEAKTTEIKKGSHKKLPATLKQALVRHHLSTLKDSNLLVQSFIQPLIIGIGSFPGFSRFGNRFFEGEINWHYFGISLLAGFLLGSLFSGPTTFIGVAMSLEKGNYHFIKTLPLSYKQFVIQKFLVIACVQFIIPTFIYTAIALFVLKINPIVTLFFTIGMITASLLTGQFYYIRDQKLLLLNWQNSNQLFGRGGGQWSIVFNIFGIMFLGMILLIVSFILANSLSSLIVSVCLAILLLVYTVVSQVYFHYSYWKKLEN